MVKHQNKYKYLQPNVVLYCFYIFSHTFYDMWGNSILDVMSCKNSNSQLISVPDELK